MSTLQLFLTILCWVVIVINVASWVAVLHHTRNHLIYRLQPNSLDAAMVIAICWLIADWIR